MCLLFWDHSILHQITSSLGGNIFLLIFLQACLWNISILSLCLWIWFAYLFILFRVLWPFHKGVRGDWIEIDRCWWTNNFCLSAVQLSVRDNCLPLKLLTLSLKMAILEPWHEHLTLTERNGRCQRFWPLLQRFVTNYLCTKKSVGGRVFNKLSEWRRGRKDMERSWEQRAWNISPKRKEIKQFIEKQRKQPKTKLREIRKKK